MEDKNYILVHSYRKCPKCYNNLVAHPPERMFCYNPNCDYSEFHMVGVFTQSLKIIYI